MKSFDIENIKNFMNELLINERYDSFYMYEAKISTGLDYFINGRLNESFFDKDELEIRKADNDEGFECFTLWKDMKQLIFELIKGKRLPLRFKVILMFNRDNIKKLIEMNQISMEASSVGALFYNIYYENGKLNVTTGASIKVFTLDKTLENVWDETVGKYYI